jgi:tRNA (pseudouridine54-N1)-methyltransferase
MRGIIPLVDLDCKVTVMRTFVLRARKGSVCGGKILSQVGHGDHSEIIAHALANAFYFSNGIREDVEVYVVLESSPDFPRTLKFTANEGLSFPGFHERAILQVVADMLIRGQQVQKNQMQHLAPGVAIYGFGFEVLLRTLLEKGKVYLLENKGTDIRAVDFIEDGIFILSDHLAMPKKSIKGLERKGVVQLSLGRKVLFASQCIVLIHNELDRQLG